MAPRTTAGWAAQECRAFRLGLLPALLVLAVVTLGPAVYLLVTSLTPLTPVNPDTEFDFSDPLGNYRQIVATDEFWGSVWVQIELSAVTVVTQVLVGLGLALLLDRPSRFPEALRAGFLVPMALPPIVVAIIWKIIYTPDINPLHHLLAWLGLPIHSLITDASTAIWVIAAAGTWEWFPFTVLMLPAALLMVPKEPQEAARIDGANTMQLFWHVRLPHIRPTLVVAALFRLIDSIKAFPLIYVLTDGGPGGATEVTNYYAFQQTFNFSYWGYGSAVATLMVAGVFVLSLVVNRMGGEAIDD